MNNIVLCGFMGCGKSTVGRNLARKTGKRFVDMDAYIEKKTGKTISEIFTDQGEDGFRDIEHEVCLELADKSNLIIATGGGALTFERNVRVFKGKDIIVLLDVPLEVSRERLAARQAATATVADRIEQAGEMFHRRLRDGFLELAKAEPERFVVIDSSGPREDVSKKVLAAVLPLEGS